MEDSFRTLRNQLLLLALATERLTSGRLMSPAEVRAHTPENGGQVHERADGWVLCGDVHPTMFEMLSGTTSVSAVICHTDKVPYLALQKQAGHWAHRFLFPVLGHTAWDYIDFIRRKGIVTSLSTTQSEIALIDKIPLTQEMAAYAIKKVDSVALPLDELLEDILNMSAIFLNPTSMPGQKEPIHDSCVTTVATADIAKLLEFTHRVTEGAVH